MIGIARLLAFVAVMAAGFITGGIGWFVAGAAFGLSACLVSLE